MQKALFLDRDGVVIHDAGYLKDPSQVCLLPGIAELISRHQQHGFRVIVVTNQSGIGRGWITLENYKQVSLRMIELLSEQNAAVDAIYFSPFFAETKLSPYSENEYKFTTQGVSQFGLWDESFRKPQPGMLKLASKDYGLDLANSIMIGDRATDWGAASLAGVSKFYFRISEIIAKEKQELIKIQQEFSGQIQTPADICFFTHLSEIESQ